MKPVEFKKNPGLGSIVPFGARAGDALLLTLIEYDVAFRNHFVRRFVDGYFVGLQTIGADARIDVSLINKNARFFWSGNRLRARIHFEQVTSFTFARPDRGWFLV